MARFCGKKIGRHYAVPTSTKGGKVRPTQKGVDNSIQFKNFNHPTRGNFVVAMSLKQRERLFRVKGKLFELYYEQASSLAGKAAMNPAVPSKQV